MKKKKMNYKQQKKDQKVIVIQILMLKWIQMIIIKQK